MAGELLAVAATGGDDLTAFAAEHLSFMNPRFAQMATPAVVVDWSLERIALIPQVTTAHLRSALNLEDQTWAQVRAGLANDSPPPGRLESK